MILLDTNVLIYAFERGAPHADWAREIIVSAVSGDGAAINAVTLAEVCVGEREPATAADRIRGWGVAILDLPAAASETCARAFALHLERRQRRSSVAGSRMPLPNFFIGAHAEIMGWDLATADKGRFETYFPALRLVCPT